MLRMKKIARTRLMKLSGLAILVASLAQPPAATFAATAARPAVQSGETKRKLERLASSMLKSSEQHLDVGEYWKAARDLIVILDFYPKYSRTDGVLTGLADCLYEMEVYSGSDKIYRHLIKKFPNSSYVPQAIFGLQRVAFQLRKFRQCAQLHDLLLAKYPKSTYKDGSAYYAAKSYYSLKHYDLAIEVAGRVGSASEYNVYGLYTIGLAHLKKKISRLPSPGLRAFSNCQC